MGKASRTKTAPDRRARVAAQREAARRAAQRKRIYLAGGSILAVVIVVVAFVLVKANSNGGKAADASNGPTGASLAKLTKDVTSVPQTVLDKVGGGNLASSTFIPNSKVPTASAAGSGYFASVKGNALTSGGKPEMLYIGAEYCPFCAAERWSMIVALSRFGTFSNLKTVHSSSTDTFPNTPTWTFYGSSYTSKYLVFTPVETLSNQRQGNSANTSTPYVALQTPTSAQNTLMNQYDPGNPSLGESGAIPFIDIANKYVEVGNMNPYGPQLLQGKSWSAIAAALSAPTSAIAQGADASANYLTAGICAVTNNQPSTACTPAIQALEKNFANPDA
jgi:hypothetical protein